MALRDLFRVKPLDQLVHETEHPDKQLKRALGPFHLTFIGIGAIIGAGIFSMVGEAAAGATASAGVAARAGAGPALIISFILVAAACSLAALCYAEFASMAPVSGSAYTYAYATLGELTAWIIGWDLILEYAVGNIAVAISWSDYLQTLLSNLHLTWPHWLGVDFGSALHAARKVAEATGKGVDLSTLGSTVLQSAEAWNQAPRLAGIPLIVNLPAVLIIAFITWILVLGIRESARFNTAMVIIKLLVIGLFVAVGAFYVKPDNYVPFSPNGWAGISSGAAVIFFAYIGFDAISTAAEETRDPQRNMPIGILASLIVCTLIYVIVAFVLTGMLKWNLYTGVADPLAKAFEQRGLNWISGIISFGAVFATTSVLLVFQLGQPRIFFSMGRDGLLPEWASRVHPKYKTPHVTTILTGIFVAVLSGISSIEEAANLCNIGTLFAFILVAAGIIVLRRTDPHRPRHFRTPFMPWVPLGAIASCFWLMFELHWVTWVRFIGWLALGLVIYFTYSRHHARFYSKT